MWIISLSHQSCINLYLFIHDFFFLTLKFIYVFIRWFVDGTPIRVFKNNQNIGVSYPVQAMQIEASIWNATWAGEPNWSQAPFQAHYQGFGIDGCPAQLNTIGSECSSPTFEWNMEKYWKLDPQQQMAYEDVRNKHMMYDYCTIGPKAPPECQTNQ